MKKQPALYVRDFDAPGLRHDAGGRWCNLGPPNGARERQRKTNMRGDGGSGMTLISLETCCWYKEATFSGRVPGRKRIRPRFLQPRDERRPS
jgi:hypothetical protein